MILPHCFAPQCDVVARDASGVTGCTSTDKIYQISEKRQSFGAFCEFCRSHAPRTFLWSSAEFAVQASQDLRALFRLRSEFQHDPVRCKALIKDRFYPRGTGAGRYLDAICPPADRADRAGACSPFGTASDLPLFCRLLLSRSQPANLSPRRCTIGLGGGVRTARYVKI